MFLFSGFLLISVILLVSKSVDCRTHAVIGNYSQLNPSDCGISRLFPNLNNNCFKWEKPITHMKDGRNASIGEAPWMAKITINENLTYTSRCSGALIPNQYILTAAHCLMSNNTKDYRIYFGVEPSSPNSPFYGAIEVHKHPGYSGKINDIGVIKLKDEIDTKSVDNLDKIRSICLPEKYVFNKEVEFVITAGWGYTNTHGWGHSNVLPLQMGGRLILALDDYSSPVSVYEIFGASYFNHSLLCAGDSGSPLWQYHMNRAVVIGVAVSFRGASARSLTTSTRVTSYIDWLKSITRLQ